MTFETLDRSALPSLFRPAGLPLPAFLHLIFLPSHTSKVDRRCSKGILGDFKLHKVPNCVCFTKRLRSRSCLHKARPRLLNINCRHPLQACPTASVPWFYVAMIMNVLAGWFFPSDYFLGIFAQILSQFLVITRYPPIFPSCSIVLFCGLHYLLLVVCLSIFLLLFDACVVVFFIYCLSSCHTPHQITDGHRFLQGPHQTSKWRAKLSLASSADPTVTYKTSDPAHRQPSRLFAFLLFVFGQFTLLVQDFFEDGTQVWR